MTQEFHLSITSLGSDRYLIRTEDAAAGVPVAEAQVTWPVEEWLQQTQPAMDHAIAGLLKGTVDLSDRATSLQQLGTKLYQALFQDDAIRESWMRAQGIAQFAHEILRLRLGLKDSRLQRLPWEVLRQGGQPLTTRTNVTFTRYAANVLVGGTPETPKRPDAGTSIHVLLVVASPNDQDHLKLLQEVRYVQELLASEAGDTAPIHIDVLAQPDRSQLAHTLEQGNYQVLHYAGHSDFGQNGGELSLVNRQTGLTERLSGDDLAGLLVNNHVALTVFNSCRSGQTAGDDHDMDWRPQNLVQALVNRGVPSVIAMAERIPDEVAIAFTRLFYHNLREGFPIDLSLSRARQGLIAGFGSDQHYWALPILYLQPDFDGYLTERDRDADDHLDPDAIEFPEATGLTMPAAAVPPRESLAPLPVATSKVSAEDRPRDLEVEPESPPIPEVLPPTVPETVSTTLLSQLHTAQASEDDDEALLQRYVQQLSDNSPTADDPVMSADQDEVLVDHNPPKTGLEIYDTLPEVPLQSTSATAAASASPPAQPSGASPRPSPTAVPSPVYAAGTSTAVTRRQPERPSLVWFALGLVGIVGIMGLSFFALRGMGDRLDAPSPSSTRPSSEPEPASSDPFSLIRRAEQAILEDRFADARDDFNLALTLATIGKADLTAVSDAIWPWVADTANSDLLFIKGRIAWQEIAQIESDPASFETGYEQRTFARQALEAWELTDDRLLEGRLARGFAHYVAGDWDRAIANWEAALNLYEEQRQRLPNPAGTTLADPDILHAYAGLVMAHTKLGNMNPIAIEEDERIAGASEDEKAILMANADKERSLARDYFSRLQALDDLEWMAPSQLALMDDSEHTWNNWLWTESLLNEWRRDYRNWQLEVNSTLPDDSE